MSRLLALLALLIAAPVHPVATPVHADILGMQVSRKVSEDEMKASLRRIEFVDEKGAALDLRALMSNGRPTLVTLWAHWCPNCRAEIAGLKAIAEKCPDAWNMVFVSARRSDYRKDAAAFQKAGLPWKFYNVSKSVETDVAMARVARAFYGETSEGAVVTPQHYLISENGAVDAIIAGRMDFSEADRLQIFCAG